MYNIKQYNKSLTYQKTISLNDVIEVSDFTADLNGGVGNMNLTLDLKVTNTDFNIGDILQIYFEGDHIYTGSILDNKKIYGADFERITLVMIGYAGLMATLLKTETYSDIASNIAKDIVDDFNTEYGTAILSYDTSSIPATVGTIDLVFTNKSYLDCLKELADTTGLKFFIDIDGKAYFGDTTVYGDHKLTVKKDINELNITEEGRNIVNTLILDYNGGTKTYTDSGSITTYGTKEKYLDKSTELANVTTADEYGASYLAENADERKKIKVEVNNKYDYFTIKPGDLLKVRNTGYTINNLQIVKISYSYERATIELERSYSFAKEIFNN